MRIVLTTEGSRGDVQPMVVLAEALAEAEHDVLLAGPPESAVLAAGRVPYQAVGISIRAKLEEIGEAACRGNDLAMIRIAGRHMRDAIPRQLADLRDATRDADLLIGSAIQLAGPTLAERHGIPYRYVAYAPLMLPSAQHPGLGVTQMNLPRWLNRISWHLVRWIAQGYLGGELTRERERCGLRPIGDVYSHVLTAAPWVATDNVFGPIPRDTRLAARGIGFLFDREGPPLPDKLELFLADGPAPVYIGFGSMPDPDPAATTRSLLEAVERAGCRAVISRGWAELGGGALPNDVFVTDAVCHHRLFRRVAAVIHHGGAGTTSTAARAGVPQIVIPHVADQTYWARCAWMAGVSPGSIARRRLHPISLAELLRACLESEVMQERAALLGERMRADDARARSAWPKLIEDIRFPSRLTTAAMKP